MMMCFLCIGSWFSYRCFFQTELALGIKSNASVVQVYASVAVAYVRMRTTVR